MGSFKILCETDEIRDKVLAKMETEGIMWASGHRPTEYYSISEAPVYLCVKQNRLTQSTFNSNTNTKITPEEYLNGGKKEMKKSDLRTGHIVTTKCGREYMVYTDVEMRDTKEGKVLVGKKGSCSWEPLDNYNEDLSHSDISNLDIVKVEKIDSPHILQDIDYKRNDRKTIWEREKEPKEMTIVDIEELLGYPVKIVK